MDLSQAVLFYVLGIIVPGLVLPAWFLWLCVRMWKARVEKPPYLAYAGAFGGFASLSILAGWFGAPIGNLGLLMGAMLLPLYNLGCGLYLSKKRQLSPSHRSARKACFIQAACGAVLYLFGVLYAFVSSDFRP